MKENFCEIIFLTLEQINKDYKSLTKNLNINSRVYKKITAEYVGLYNFYKEIDLRGEYTKEDLNKFVERMVNFKK